MSFFGFVNTPDGKNVRGGIFSKTQAMVVPRRTLVRYKKVSDEKI